MITFLQSTCVETLSCFPESIMDIFRVYEYQVGIPVVIMLGLLVGMIILAIYVRTRSLAHLTVMGVYAITAFSTMWAADEFLESNMRYALYVIAFGIATVITLMVLKLVKE